MKYHKFFSYCVALNMNKTKKVFTQTQFNRGTHSHMSSSWIFLYNGEVASKKAIMRVQ